MTTPMTMKWVPPLFLCTFCCHLAHNIDVWTVFELLNVLFLVPPSHMEVHQRTRTCRVHTHHRTHPWGTRSSSTCCTTLGLGHTHLDSQSWAPMYLWDDLLQTTPPCRQQILNHILRTVTTAFLWWAGSIHVSPKIIKVESACHLWKVYQLQNFSGEDTTGLAWSPWEEMYIKNIWFIYSNCHHLPNFSYQFQFV